MPEWRAVYEGNPDVVAAIIPPTHKAIWDFDPDVAIDFHGGNTAARLTLFSRGAKLSALPATATTSAEPPTMSASPDVHRKSPDPPRTVHTAEHMATAMFYLGARQREIPRACLFADPPSTARAPYAVIHPVAATPEKTWHADGFLQVARHLRSEHRLEPVFIAAAGQDLSAFAAWETVVGAPLSALKTLISGATLFVGNDSGPAHIAAAFGVPPVVIFGPSDPVIWGPWRTPGEVVKASGPIESVTTAQVLAACDLVS